MLHREHSNDLLKIWRAQLDKEVDDGDNDAYLTAYQMVEKEIAKLQLGKKDNFSGRVSSNDSTMSYSKRPRISNPNITASSQKRFVQYNQSYIHSHSRRFANNFTSGNSNIRSSEHRINNSTAILTTTIPPLPSLLSSASKGRNLKGDPAISFFPLETIPDEAAEEGISLIVHNSGSRSI